MNKRITSFIRLLYGEPEAFIPLHAPIFSEREKELLVDCIDSTFVSSVGEYVGRFEDMVRDYVGARGTVAVVNGTCALTAALGVAGVGHGDLVITQGLTFVATANAIVHAGAQPVFLDSDEGTLGMSHNALEGFLDTHVEMRSGVPVHKESGRRISACVPMHVFGHACRIDAIVEICDRWNIPVVEDAAESLGSSYNGRMLGTFGTTGVLSFNGNKIITTGGGGMILVNDPDKVDRVRHLVSTAKQSHPWEFRHNEVAWNFRMPNINAALGCAQMERIGQMVDDKREIAAAYEEFFEKEPGVEFMREPEGCRSNYWLCAVMFEDRNARNAFLELANGEGVMCRPAWELMTELPMYASAINDGLEVAGKIVERLVNLPSGARKSE